MFIEKILHGILILRIENYTSRSNFIIRHGTLDDAAW